MNQGVEVKKLHNNRVLIPKYYWKIVCDPQRAGAAGASVAFVSENPTGADPQDGCNLVINNVQQQLKAQTPSKGIINCYSLEDFQKKWSNTFNFPLFSPNCNPSVRGTFLDKFLSKLVK